MVLVVVGGLDSQLGIIWVMSVELERALESRGVLSMDLVGCSPEDTLPDQAGLSILQPQVILIINRLGSYREVKVCHVEPEADSHSS